ncbi:DUF2306 domain-containing protein [Parerythrobacter aestuarii]|uniref:DUF2306 domain-containing protein n=1 Tax=Parerythrobacter aestuarii TaxID=3020909 RepID=UPI0024DEBBCC|nr:DUF2306 domain-containing protein [Parerythrobacter aestuarii]
MSSLSSMPTLALLMPFTKAKPGPVEYPPVLRMVILCAGIGMTLLASYATIRGATGIAPAHPNIRHLAVAIHVATVLPTVPLGAYLLIARKGTSLHKLLGRIWIGLMTITALCALFIRPGGSFSWIHLFVPLVLLTSWKVVASARRGDMATHRKEIVGLYLGALVVPGLFAFFLPGRLMNVWTFGWPIGFA